MRLRLRLRRKKVHEIHYYGRKILDFLWILLNLILNPHLAILISRIDLMILFYDIGKFSPKKNDN